ncbi:hypothetical protein GCM10023212_24490 [Luteolibacter yonseiensis]
MPVVVPGVLRRVNGGCLATHAILWSRAGMIRAWNHLYENGNLIVDQAFAGLQAIEPHFYAPDRWVTDQCPEAVPASREITHAEC